MHALAKFTLGVSVVGVVAVCGLAYVTGSDDRRDFVCGTTSATLLPTELLMVDGEVDDEYDDDDDDDTEEEEETRVTRVAPVAVKPVMNQKPPLPVSTEVKGSKVRGPEIDDQYERQEILVC